MVYAERRCSTLIEFRIDSGSQKDMRFTLELFLSSYPVLVSNIVDLINQGVYSYTKLVPHGQSSVVFGQGIPPMPYSEFSSALCPESEALYRNAEGELDPEVFFTGADENAPHSPMVCHESFAVALIPSKSCSQLILHLDDRKEFDTDKSKGAIVIGRLVNGRSLLKTVASTLSGDGVLGEVVEALVQSAKIANDLLRFELASSRAFVVELFNGLAPLSVSNILDLVKSNFYDGLHIHRVIRDFIFQFGCPNSVDPTFRGMGNGAPPPNSKFTITLLTGESSEVTRDKTGKIMGAGECELSNSLYSLSMANSGPPFMSGSQFFVNLGHNSKLDWYGLPPSSKHPVIGRVILGHDVIDGIGKVKVSGKTDVPCQPLKVNTVRCLL